MTLGEIIKEYSEDHSISQFIKDSGLSKAYVYMLIANKNNKGEPITPSIETIRKVAKGMHISFDEIFNRLDFDFMVHLGNLNAEPDDISNTLYFSNQEIRDIAEFLFNNPDYKELFEASKNVHREDINLVRTVIERINQSNHSNN